MKALKLPTLYEGIPQASHITGEISDINAIIKKLKEAEVVKPIISIYYSTTESVEKSCRYWRMNT